MKGANAQAEIDAAAKELRRFKVHDVEIVVLGEGLLTETTRVVRATVG
jgi:16S rRNA (guanine527-N7)-methyltransferase